MGLLRLFLALSVIAGHAETTVFSFNGIGAWYAVNLFFIISGFYMAMVLNGKYKDISPIHFYKSRIFRLFPTYYVGVLIALIVSFGAISNFFDHLSIGAKIYFVFQNLFIFGQDLSYLLCVKTISFECAYPVGMTINPPAWSLAVELGFYLIAPFVVKSEKKTFAFVLLGCVYLLSLNGINFPLGQNNHLGSVDISTFNYYFYPSSFIFFGGGALAYHLSKRNPEPHYFAAVFAIVLLSFTQTIMPFWHLLFISMSIPVLFNYTAKNRIDRSIGELSYPAYILHFPVLLFIKPYMKSHPQYFSFIGLGSWVAIVSCAMGLLIYVSIEQKVSKYRESKNFFQNPFFNEKFGKRISIILLLCYLFVPIFTVTYVYKLQYGIEKKADTSPFNLTDANWVNGVGVKLTGFFVNNSPLNIEHYRVGQLVRFSNGEIRKIILVEQAGTYLNIYLDGQPLDGKYVGFPNKIEVLK